MVRYVEVDKAADQFVKTFAYSMCGAVFFMIFGPATMVLYHYIRGTFTQEILKLPVDAL